MIGESLRARLTIWYTGILALVLVSFAAVSYAVIARGAELLEDATVRSAAEALGSAIVEEAAHESGEPATPDTGRRTDEEVASVVRAFRFGESSFYVVSPAGGLLATSGVEPSAATAEHVAALLAAAAAVDPALATVDGHRVTALRAATVSGTYTVVVAHPLDDQRKRLADVRRAFAFAIPVALLLAAVGGSVLVRKGLGPLTAMAAQAERIEAARLHERLHVPNERDEVGRLARVFNALLSRLEASFERQRRFMADASHELRTPVAIVRGEAEVALSRGDRGASDYRDSLDIIYDEGRRLTSIVDDLFMLARADAGQRRIAETDLSLDEVVGDAARAVRSLADGHGVRVVVEPGPELPCRGDAELLSRVFVNLLDNAIKYTPSGGEVRVHAEARASDLVVTVTDTGVGIPEEARAHVFERFYRVERARATAGEGSGAGLGLSIARWIAEAHGGTLELVASSERGTTFEVRLPRSGEKDDGGEAHSPPSLLPPSRRSAR